MNRNDLFVRLAKYPATSVSTPKENFFTQLVAYILKNDEAARREFVNTLWKQRVAQRGLWPQPNEKSLL